MPLEHLLREADFVCPVVPLSAQTRNLISRKELSLMKSESILINVSRGAVVDEEALIDALQNQRIRAAGLDVYAKEPMSESPLFKLTNAVTVPHIGSATTQTRLAMAQRALKNLLMGLNGNKSQDLVKPEVL